MTHSTYIEQLHQERDAYKQALKLIAAETYGLQGLYEDGASQEEIDKYWIELATRMRKTAREALAKFPKEGT